MSYTDSITELRSALEEKQAFLREGLDKGVKIDGDTIEMKGGDYSAMQKAVADIKELKSLVEMHDLADETKDILSDLSAPAGLSAAVAAAAGGNFQQEGPRSLGSRFVQSDEFKSLQASGRLTMDTPYTVEGEADITSGYGQKDVYTGSLTGAVNPRGFGRVQFDPAIPRAQRQTRVRDLFPVASTSANLIDYFRVKGFTENSGRGAAATVPERTGEGTSAVFGLKPKSTLVFESAQAPVRTIAHWEAAHRNVLRDEPQLQSTIDNELLYGLALAEDDQILNGDCTGENLLGILNTPGVQGYSMQAGDQRSDALRRSATLSILANFPGTGFVLHPLDWEEIELQKASSGDGQYMLVSNVAIGAQTSVWRQPVVESPAMTEGEWLTGAFGLGAQLYDREIANVRIAEQHADFFVRNAIAILAEERLALAVKRPESFVHGSFSVTP